MIAKSVLRVWSRPARATTLGALTVLLVAVASAQAAGPKLQLFNNGNAVPNHQHTWVTTEASFPGFTCSGFAGAFQFDGGPAATLKFMASAGAEGGNYAFDTCETESGEEVGTGTEGPIPKLHLVKITSTTVTETFKPTAQLEDNETECVWKIRKLSGPLPESGSLTGLSLTGTATLVGPFSAKTCPKRGAVSATVTIEPSEGAPPGGYEVKTV